MAGRRDVMQSIKQKTKDLLLKDRILCLSQNANLNLSEQSVRDLIHRNRSVFKTCYARRDIVPKLQQIIITEKIKELVKAANLEWSERNILNLALNWEVAFRGCETQEDSLQRLQDLDPIIKLQ